MSNSSKTRRKSKPTPPRLRIVKLDTQETVPPPLKKFKPLTAFAKPISRKEGVQYEGKIDRKGKSRDATHDNQDNRLWIEMYEPTVEAELAVHKKKVESVRHWFLEAFDGGPSGRLKKYRRILVLTGPAGTGKTTTIRVLARELGFEILEWKNTVEAGYSNNDDITIGIERSIEKFQAFLTRASICQNLFTLPERQGEGSTPSPPLKRKVILLEDLPNILHPRTQQDFHAALESLAMSAGPNAAPIVIIVSDVGLRGEESDDKMIQASSSRGRDVVDIRTVLPPSLLHSAYVTQISFNPIAPTFLRKALQSLLNAHFSHSAASPPREVLDLVVESANGDIRSAIMGLQFACLIEVPSNKRGRKKSLAATRVNVVLEAVTRREQSLALFHLMGKVLYNKRKRDPPNPSATAKDIQREAEIDAQLKDPPSHPFLKTHDRRASRVDVDTLYADSPIDSSLFSLYIHQNYTQFCNEMEECDGIAEWLSWVDSSGGEAWYQANPHRFHLLTLGTLHSLPTPVSRRSQKFLKPEFFQARSREKDAWDAVADVRRWINGEFTTTGLQRDDEEFDTGIGRWSMVGIATELGGVLKARDNTDTPEAKPPSSHRTFSRLAFVLNDGNDRMLELGEGDPGDDIGRDVYGDEGIQSCRSWDKERANGGWLESDDIED